MNLGFGEMIFIFVLALIIFGPKKMPEIGRQIGRALAEFRRRAEAIGQYPIVVEPDRYRVSFDLATDASVYAGLARLLQRFATGARPRPTKSRSRSPLSTPGRWLGVAPRS